MNKITIAIDGPAGSGKSTVAKLVAHRLNYDYVDTGAMYRALTLKALRLGINPSDEKALVNLIDNTVIEFSGNNLIYVDDVDESLAIRSSIVSANVSNVSAHKGVRLKMVELQRKLLNSGGVVMDGRDIGSYVCPSAELKIYQTASVEARSLRRFQENQAKGMNCTIKEVEEDIKNRDRIDSSRAFAPLVKANDAIEIDTSLLTVEQVVDFIVNLAKEKIANV